MLLHKVQQELGQQFFVQFSWILMGGQASQHKVSNSLKGIQAIRSFSEMIFWGGLDASRPLLLAQSRGNGALQTSVWMITAMVSFVEAPVKGKKQKERWCRGVILELKSDFVANRKSERLQMSRHRRGSSGGATSPPKNTQTVLRNHCKPVNCRQQKANRSYQNQQLTEVTGNHLATRHQPKATTKSQEP